MLSNHFTRNITVLNPKAALLGLNPGNWKLFESRGHLERGCVKWTSSSVWEESVRWSVGCRSGRQRGGEGGRAPWGLARWWGSGGQSRGDEGQGSRATAMGRGGGQSCAGWRTVKKEVSGSKPRLSMRLCCTSAITSALCSPSAELTLEQGGCEIINSWEFTGI